MRETVDIKELLAREMSRKEFLQLTAGAVIALLGVGNFIKYLLAHSRRADNGQKIAGKTSNGFGSRKFGA